MTDNAKKPRRDGGVNMDMSGLAAWDHRPGDHDPKWYRARGAREEDVLSEVNQPSSYLGLTDAEKAALQEWVARELRPSSSVGPKCSYALKHIFDRLPGGFYVNNGAFKGAMLAAGFKPIDRTELNWSWRYKLADPQLPAKSIGRAGCRGGLKAK